MSVSSDSEGGEVEFYKFYTVSRFPNPAKNGCSVGNRDFNSVRHSILNSSGKPMRNRKLCSKFLPGRLSITSLKFLLV